jgi:sialic acid synthase SpsE/RimJ/RimL family protein N-acetyltransferase
MDNISFELVQRCESHARHIMEWRNDPETLRVSFHRALKVWEDFYPEFLSTYFSCPSLPPVFALYEEHRVGFLRFREMPHKENHSRRCCDISINLAPQHRGRGFAKKTLAAAVEYAANAGFDDIYAEIREGNTISQKVFTRAGYTLIGKEKKLIEDTGETCDIISYVYNITPPLIKNDGVFVIAEAGSNWRMGTNKRDLAMAKTLIDVARDAGADAVKFQTYRPEKVYVKNAGKSDYLSNANIKEDITDIFADLAMPYDMLPELAAYCESNGILFMSTPFSVEDFEAIDPYVSVHKLASYELSHLRLIEHIAKTKKPLIMSTGASGYDNIAWALKTYYDNGGITPALLQCTAQYPADVSAMNLSVIPALKRCFHVHVGLSDHSRNPIAAPCAAVGLGATVVEKHFTLDNRLPGPDHSFAVTPSELTHMVETIRLMEKMRGDGIKKVEDAEKELFDYARRGIQALQDINIGDTLCEGRNIDILRPGQQTMGVHPKFIIDLEGKTATREILEGKGIQHGDWR